MHHSGIHKFDSYEKCVAAVELEVECLKEQSMSKTQSSANFVQAKPKAKDGKAQGPGKRKADSKEKSGTEGGISKKKKKTRSGKKPKKGMSKATAKCHRYGKPCNAPSPMKGGGDVNLSGAAQQTHTNIQNI